MGGETTRSFHSESADRTRAAGERLGRDLVERYPQGVVVLLVGPLGAGKTVMAQGIARGIGVLEPVMSPTYTIISEYRTPARSLHHVDLYRVEGEEQLENLGLDDLMRGSGIVLVEWGEKLEQAGAADGAGRAVPGPLVRVTISLAPDDGRDVSIQELPE